MLGPPPTPVLLATDNGDDTFLLEILSPISGAGIASVQIFISGADEGLAGFGDFPLTTGGRSGVDTFQLALNGDGVTYSGQSPLSNISP